MKTIQTVCLVFILFSCTRLHVPDRQNLLSLDNNAAGLNGHFKNSQADTSKLSMWDILIIHEGNKISHSGYDLRNAYVQFTATGKNSIVAKLFVDSSLIAQKIFTGKIKGNYFSVKRKIIYWGVPFIVGKQSDLKLQFAKDKDNNLYIDEAYSAMGWIFIMAAGVDDKGNYVYEPKQK